MTDEPNAVDLANSVLIVAHPDDEVLWFASLLQAIGHIVICYGPGARMEGLGERRARALASYPLANMTFLEMRQPLRCPPQWGDIADENDNPVDQMPCQRALEETIGPFLHGRTAAFTHNPWGEYGHGDHVLVNRAVNAVAGRNVPVFVSGYVGPRAVPRFRAIMNDGVQAQFARPIDRSLAHRIKAVYVEHECWTWTKLWEWPAIESFFRVGEGMLARESAIAVNFFTR